ncbi:hypothetical protein ACO0LC_28940 [Undibacterium sp. JH2W]|uniref:hypothetical protein n=1 Tax=Undibacterium sp. JH2W TaxID=3413037 RepID=UPI003BF17BE8
MEQLYYLQDSRSLTGACMMFWAQDGKGYTSDLRKAHVYTKDEAVSQHRSREADIPWPKAYIDAHKHRAVDHQHLKDDETTPYFANPDCVFVFQVDGFWNGNDVYWQYDEGNPPGPNFNKAISERYLLPRLIPWPADYIETKARPVVHIHNVSLKQALKGTGITIIKPQKHRAPPLRCSGCNRFMSLHQFWSGDCRKCGMDSRP